MGVESTPESSGLRWTAVPTLGCLFQSLKTQPLETHIPRFWRHLQAPSLFLNRHITICPSFLSLWLSHLFGGARAQVTPEDRSPKRNNFPLRLEESWLAKRSMKSLSLYSLLRFGASESNWFCLWSILPGEATLLTFSQSPCSCWC